MIDDTWVQAFQAVVEKRLQAGNPVNLWLRDDDTVEPSEPLHRLLMLTQQFSVPLTLAVIPAFSDEKLAQYLAAVDHVCIAVHGWSHSNYAGPDEKKQELGLHRPLDIIVSELRLGLSRLAGLHGRRFVPLLVPPWNRISPIVIEELYPLGYRALSTFGESDDAVFTMINTQVDLMDWKGSRGCRDHNVLAAELIDHIEHTPGPIGLLTHHLVHDESAWHFLEQIMDITTAQHGCEWVSVRQLMS